jgi:PleD family two-component response regulator
MKILVVDRDKLSAQIIRSKLEAGGFSVVEEPEKNNAMEILKKESVDGIFFDPAPIGSAQPVVLAIRRSSASYPYIVLLTQDITREDAFRMGCNDILHKPVTGSEAVDKAHNAARLSTLVHAMGDESEDFPSAGGVISKSAFNQLFRSAIDRAGRYGEKSFIVMISVDNYDDIKLDNGAYAADFTVSKMAQHLAHMRRQSDIIGQTAKYQYALLLQRPMSESEPVEAASRFAATLEQVDDIASTIIGKVDMSVKLIHLPTGQLEAEHKISKSGGITSGT